MFFTIVRFLIMIIIFIFRICLHLFSVESNLDFGFKFNVRFHLRFNFICAKILNFSGDFYNIVFKGIWIWWKNVINSINILETCYFIYSRTQTGFVNPVKVCKSQFFLEKVHKVRNLIEKVRKFVNCTM